MPERVSLMTPVSHKLRKLMKYGRLKHILLMSISAVLILFILLSTIAFWFVRRTLPQTTGTLTVAGLEQPVTVGRDQWGVPHITASNLHDLTFAQGYVTAQDRLFQMEMNRRVAQGRLAEIFGAGSNNQIVNADAFLRTLGVYRAAQSDLASADEQDKAIAQEYADGVNAFIKTHTNNIPLEFSILGFTPGPWTSVDSLASAFNVALALDSSWYYKYTRALIQAKASLSVANLLFPSYPADNPTLLDISGQNATSISKPLLPYTTASKLSPDLLQGATVVHELLGNVSGSLGSNNWVVDGTRTVSGKPLLANDPHLAISMPSVWYEVALHSQGLNVIGFSLPGAPGVIIGHNDHIAWGVTNAEADNTDLYLETLDPTHHPGRYRYNNQWLPLQTRQESIYVRDSNKPIIITVASTLHGPLLNSVVGDLKQYRPVALKWTLLQPGYTFAGFFQLDGATDWPQFIAALNNISISQNFVYADVQGNIGYRMSGMLPIRPVENRFLPVDGSTSKYDWRGYVSQEKMPMLFNPPTHVIVTANNRIVSDNYPIYVTSYWDQGYRAQRIIDLLALKPHLSISDYERMQADVYSIPAATVTRYFVAAGQDSRGDAATAASLLHGWDFTMALDSIAASVYEVTVGMLLREMIEPLLGKQLYNTYTSNYLSTALYSLLIVQLRKPTAPFFGITDQSQATVKRDAAIAYALSEAMKQLRTQLGSDSSHWRWGKLHQAHFDHPLASMTPFNLIFGLPPLERPGDSATVNIGGDDAFSADFPNYDQQTVSSMREIIDLSNFDNSLWIITTGESGQPFSAHYNDLNALWDQNRYQCMDFTPHAKERTMTQLLTLLPVLTN